jgi:hypothetical protein
VIGSQANRGSFPDAPPELTESLEADVFPKEPPERSIVIDGGRLGTTPRLAGELQRIIEARLERWRAG